MYAKGRYFFSFRFIFIVLAQCEQIYIQYKNISLYVTFPILHTILTYTDYSIPPVAIVACTCVRPFHIETTAIHSVTKVSA